MAHCFISDLFKFDSISMTHSLLNTTVNCISSSSVMPFGHCLHFFFQDFPLATQLGSFTCTCWTKPGASCCTFILIPGPWQSLSVFSQLDASTHITCLIYSTSNCSPVNICLSVTRMGTSTSRVPCSC